MDQADLKAMLGQQREEPIGGRCALEKNLMVLEATCGGTEFIRKGMRPYWKDTESKRRLTALPSAPVYPLAREEEIAFQELLQKETKEGIIKVVSRSEVRLLNSVFMVEKKKAIKGKKKFRKIVDCRPLNSEQVRIHFRMDGPLVLQEISLPGDKAT
jgi:hypothetical protein